MQEYLAGLNAMVNPQAPQVIDVNTQNVYGGNGQMSRNLPLTNAQSGMQQNEAAKNDLKSRR